MWITQRLPLVEIRANARQNRRITNVRTVNRYLSLARQRMVEELIQNRLQHQAEQIYGLNELIHQAMVAGQFNAAAALLHFDHPVANAGQAGIDSEDDHGLAVYLEQS